MNENITLVIQAFAYGMFTASAIIYAVLIRIDKREEREHQERMNKLLNRFG